MDSAPARERSCTSARLIRAPRSSLTVPAIEAFVWATANPENANNRISEPQPRSGCATKPSVAALRLRWEVVPRRPFATPSGLRGFLLLSDPRVVAPRQPWAALSNRVAVVVTRDLRVSL